jgi:hypothetical protein
VSHTIRGQIPFKTSANIRNWAGKQWFVSGRDASAVSRQYKGAVAVPAARAKVAAPLHSY